MTKENFIQNGQFPIETKGENLPKKTVNEWITQDYQNALVVASNVLTRIQMKDFESYVKGALLQGKSAKEIANESGRVLTTFEDVLQRAKVRLSNRLNLDLGNGKAGHSLKMEYRIKYRKELIDKAKNGDKEAVIKLINSFPGTINSFTNRIESDQQSLFLAVSYQKVNENIDQFEYRGNNELRHWLLKLFSQAEINYFRKKQIRKKILARQEDLNSAENGLVDYFNLWVNNNPRKLKKILSGMPKKRMLIFQAASGGMSNEDVARVFKLTSKDSAKVTIHNIKTKIMHDAGVTIGNGVIKLQDGKEFKLLRGLAKSKNHYLNLIGMAKKGKLKEAVLFLGRYYVDKKTADLIDQMPSNEKTAA